MYYYAVLNENNFVVELVTSETEIIDNTYISITEEQYTSGDLLWLYYKQGQFIVCDNFIGSCDWIIYKNTDRPITPKFDEIDEQIAGKANSNHTHDTATQTADGFISSDDKTKLDGIEAGANNYTHPETHPASMITGLADVATSGSYTDLTNKPTIPTSLPADGGNADTLDGYHAAYFASGQHNHDSEYAAATHTHDYAASSHIHGEATTSAAGFMSAADKTKLNGISDNANAYTHPSTHAASMITGLADVATSGSYSDLSDTPTSMTPTDHTHAQSDITGLATALSGKASSSHNHDSRYYTGEQVDELLSGFASANHTHTAAQVGAAASNHNHNSAYVSKQFMSCSIMLL